MVMRSFGEALALAVVVGARVALHMVAAPLSLVARRANFTSLVVALQGVALELLACSPLYQLEHTRDTTLVRTAPGR